MNSIRLIKKTLFTVFVLALYLCDSATNGSSSSSSSSSYAKELTEEKNIISRSRIITNGPYEKFSVYVLSYLPNDTSTPVYVNCKSKDDDLGQHVLHANEYFNWDFQVNFVDTTLYFCGFQWRSKHAKFDVFNNILGDKCENPENGNKCVWTIGEQGFYLENVFPPVNPTKLHDWE